MSYEEVMPAAAHPGLAESLTIGIGPDQVDPDPLVVVERPGGDAPPGGGSDAEDGSRTDGGSGTADGSRADDAGSGLDDAGPGNPSDVDDVQVVAGQDTGIGEVPAVEDL